MLDSQSAAAGQLLDRRIPVAEDSPESSRLIAWSLRRGGAPVDLAANGRESLALFDAHRESAAAYQLLLTDIEMSELDGFELTRALRLQGARSPIIALTGRDQAGNREAVSAAGCDDHATKPCEIRQLVSACRKWLPAAALPLPSQPAEGVPIELRETTR